DHRAPAERRQSPCRLAPDQETRKATDPPELLKELRRDLAEIHPLVVTGIEDGKIGRLAAAPPGHGAVKQRNHLRLARSRHQTRLGRARGRGNSAPPPAGSGPPPAPPRARDGPPWRSVAQRPRRPLARRQRPRQPPSADSWFALPTLTPSIASH